VPVITIRDTTERPETVEAGSNIVASTDPARILEAARFVHGRGPKGDWTAPPEYLEPNVSEKIARIILSNLTWAAAQIRG
jgi:UDP-N-acetylglucosamine 2-epimerase (non-hydrolysing)